MSEGVHIFERLLNRIFLLEGLVINLGLQLWILSNTETFLEQYLPKFAGDPVLQHPIVLLLARSWAYMIIVLGIFMVSIIQYGSRVGKACLLIGALLGDIMHLILFAIFFAEHGLWDFGSKFGVIFTTAIALARIVWLGIFFSTYNSVIDSNYRQKGKSSAKNKIK
mmetsp:Transcript_20597/g.33439  ORF Transcript_20597/g.33439 Transcript_20597/m.33439 type:complete len:166 (+) Transcript_20597:85-582(+)